MSVYVDLIGSLGDSLFQYAFGRLLAEYHGLSLTVTGQGDNRWRQRWLPPVAGASLATPLVDISTDTTPDWDLHTIDPTRLYAAAPGRFRLKGYFQRIAYFENQLERIAGWYSPDDDAVQPTYDIVVHFSRPPAFAQRGWLLPTSYYRDALDRCVRGGSILFCGDVLTDEILSLCDACGAEFAKSTGFDVLSRVRAAKTVITSNDTISWWAAALSPASHILAPHSADGRGYAFTGYASVDLELRQRHYSRVDVNQFLVGRVDVRSLILGATIFSVGDHLAIAGERQVTHLIAASPGERRLASLLVSVGSIPLRALRAQLAGLFSSTVFESFLDRGLCRTEVVCDANDES